MPLNPLITSVTDSLNGGWSIPASAKTTGQGGNTVTQIVYAGNASTASTLSSVTVTSDSVDPGDSIFNLYDIADAAASPFDLATVMTGNQTSNGRLTMGVITPRTDNGIIICVSAIDFHTCNSMSAPTGGRFDTCFTDYDDNDPPGGGTDVSTLDMDNCYAHYYNPNTSSVSFTFGFTHTSGGTQGILLWGAATAAFKGAPVEVPSSQFNRFIMP